MKKPAAIIMAGGQSLRLYPTTIPKPLLKVTMPKGASKTLLELTLDRLDGFDCYLVAKPEILKAIKLVLKARLKNTQLIAEPEARDTAAAVGWALRHISKGHPWIGVFSADQYLADDESKFKSFSKKIGAEILRYPNSIFVAGSSASQKPRAKHSQFGWFTTESFGRRAGSSARVTQFIEKPKGSALKKIRDAKGLINCGMFFALYDTFIQAYKTHYPDVFLKRLNYKSLSKQPIDRAIIEKHQDVRAFHFSLKWEDLGTWLDWHQLNPEPNFVRSDDGFAISIFGITNLAVVQSQKRILVIPLDQTPNLKDFLN